MGKVEVAGMLIILIERGADMTTQNTVGWTPNEVMHRGIFK